MAAAVLPGPEALPAIAVGQPGLYRLELALLVFYGGLLFVTPAFSGLVRGQLPIEISTRGARFVEEAEQATNVNEKTIENLKALIDDLTERQLIADAEIRRLEETKRDNAQPPIGSKR